MDISIINFHSSFSSIPIFALIVLGIVPLIATVVSFARHVAGFNGFSVFVTVVTALAFLDLGFFGGILVSGIIFFSTLGARRILAKFRFHYYVRISFVYTAVCFLVFFVVSIISAFLNIETFTKNPLFPMILLITLVEEYYTSTIREGERKVILMYVETLCIAGISFFLITSAFFSEYVLKNPWVLVLLFPINLFLASYQGLRLSEFYRFKSVISNEMKIIEEEEEEDKKKKKRKKKEAVKEEVKPKTFIW